MSKKEFEIFLYKNKLNNVSLIDIIPQLSIETINNLTQDLNLSKNETNNEILYVFCDGGSRGNGKKNAKAGYSVYFGESEPFCKFNKTKLCSGENQTNNKAELLAIKLIFTTIYENIELFKNSSVIIVTDSKYSINCINTWANNWIKNGWVNSKGEDVKNKEIIGDILKLKNKICDNLNIKFKHIFSHTIEPSNKKSSEWYSWKGNNIVDTNINKILDLAYN